MKLHYKLKYLLLVILLLNFTSSFANFSQLKGKYKKEKRIKKEFKVTENAMLMVDNSYGNLDIITWEEHKIVFEITITTSGNDEQSVEEKLDNITVEFSNSPTLVSAETIINSKRSSWLSWFRNNTTSMEINYLIKMPITNSVTLNNDYGDIMLQQLKGSSSITCDYGKITTQELFSTHNKINFDYSNNCYFEYINSGEITADYSEFTVDKAKNIKLNADYTKSVITTAENVKYNCDYGALKIEKVNTVYGNGDYLTTRIGTIYKTATLNSDYGSIKIDKIAENAENITIEGDYTGIRMGIHPNYRFNFYIDLDYASLSSELDLQFSSKNLKNTSKSYEGYYGSKNTGNVVVIESDYGSVKINPAKN